jgi:hypothetical protein
LARSLDPSVLDPAARGIAHDAEYAAQRYRNATTVLTAHHQAAIKREEKAGFDAIADAVELKVAQAADRMIEVYQRCVAELVSLFKDTVAPIDREVDRVNSLAPAGCRQLRKTEAVARNIPALHQNDVSVIEMCTLPPLIFGHNSGAVVNAWPPTPENVGVAYAAMVAAACGVVPTDNDEGESVWDEKRGSYVWRSKNPRPIRGGPVEPMRPGETQHQYILRQQAKQAEESARHIAYGMADERKHQQLNAEAAARAEAAAAGRRRAEAGG